MNKQPFSWIYEVSENTPSLLSYCADYTALYGLSSVNYMLLYTIVVRIIRHNAVRGVMTIRHYADLQDGLYGIMRFEV